MAWPIPLRLQGESQSLYKLRTIINNSKIPDAIPSEDAAPMLCGGITVYSPLKNNGAGPSKRVGIVGIGGLGHFGILYAKALGASTIVAVSRTSAKKSDALALGADKFIATNEDKDWAKHNAKTLDVIISTVSSPDLPIVGYLQLLRTQGVLIQVGLPEDAIPGFNAGALVQKGVKIGGSAIGSPDEIEEMLALSAEKGVKPWIEARPMKEANQAVKDMVANKARYRYTLVNERHTKI